MRHEGGFRFLAALAVLGLIGIFAVGAFGAGFAAGSASDATANPVWVHDGAFWGGHIIGFLVTILLVLILFRLIVLAIFGHHRRSWAHGRHWHDWSDADRFGPGPGQGSWHRSEWREAGQAYFDEFHRRAHGTEPPATGGSSTEGAGGEQSR